VRLTAPDHPTSQRIGPVLSQRNLSQRDLSRRSFLRRVLGAGIGLLSLEFVGGSLAFLWPNLTEGLGASFRVGSVDDILIRDPRFAAGYPFSYGPARSFLINVPAARALASGETVDLRAPAAADLLALWRKCPHLGCMVPELCDSLKRFTCRCHGSTYNILGEKLEKGPAQRGMDHFGVVIEEDGMVVIDTREVISGPPVGTLSFTDPFAPEIGCS
jgi:cytochrome b6-f complex iron-sulfur subunit